MKRHGNLFDRIVEMDNLRLAYKNAKRGKSWQRFERAYWTNHFIHRLRKLIDIILFIREEA